MKFDTFLSSCFVVGRRLHGRRGLKSQKMRFFLLMLRRRLHGRRGLKFKALAWVAIQICRRLHGRRGLKCLFLCANTCRTGSPPSRAAWIEIATKDYQFVCGMSPPSRAAWIEMGKPPNASAALQSPPSRAAWIEIRCSFVQRFKGCVAAFTGGVD